VGPGRPPVITAQCIYSRNEIRSTTLEKHAQSPHRGKRRPTVQGSKYWSLLMSEAA
jgi:hypothetical protein